MSPSGLAGRPFVKVCGGGNDFILVDERASPLPLDGPELARIVCQRALSVGADGLILIRPSTSADLAMVYFNADGSRAFCGNGTRCVARWAHLHAGLPQEMTLETDRGVLRARIRGERAEVDMATPIGPRPGPPLDGAGLPGHGLWLDTGCPHVVVIVATLPGPEFADRARPVRHHASLGPEGANVDFVTVEDPHRLRLRSFERGVEGETLACGTGAVAATLAAASRSLVASPVTCLTRGGQSLRVRFRRTPDGWADVTLEGDGRIVYRGEFGAEVSPAASSAP